MGKRGLSLVEVVVAVVLLAAAVMFILGLIPAGILSLKQAENVQTANAYAVRLLEEAPRPASFPSPVEQFATQLNGTQFTATRQAVVTGTHTYEWRVSVNWPEAARPLEMSLRRFSSDALP
ncbi:MAG: prepilin-type N-terminal cleavage/methylation domain-containing protein [Vulcanimicrobiota bacterium]